MTMWHPLNLFPGLTRAARAAALLGLVLSTAPMQARAQDASATLADAATSAATVAQPSRHLPEDRGFDRPVGPIAEDPDNTTHGLYRLVDRGFRAYAETENACKAVKYSVSYKIAEIADVESCSPFSEVDPVSA